MPASAITAIKQRCFKVSGFITRDILSTLIADMNRLSHCVVMDGLVLRVMMDGLILRIVMDGLGLSDPVVLVRRGVILL